jgi:hypothetical protein
VVWAGGIKVIRMSSIVYTSNDSNLTKYSDLLLFMLLRILVHIPRKWGQESLAQFDLKESFIMQAFMMRILKDYKGKNMLNFSLEI